MRNSILKTAIFCLLLQPLCGYEVKTETYKSEQSSDRGHYPEFAKRFSETLLSHPPVYDCHVQLHDFGLEISIQIDRPSLHNYLTEVHQKSAISHVDEQRYLHDFKITIKKAASDIFTDIKTDAIIVSIVVK